MSENKSDRWDDLKNFVMLLGTSGAVVGALTGFYWALKLLFA